jgi:hypothetical protein
MKSPTTYSEWINLLDRFGNGDDTILPILIDGKFELDAGTATRFYFKVEEAYKKRKLIWLDKFQRLFNFQNFRKDEEFEIALRNGKQNLNPLINYVTLKSFPEDLSKTLKKDLNDFVTEIKKSLKENVSKNSRGREKTLIMLNSFDIFSINNETSCQNNLTNMNLTATNSGRKIIF